MTDSITAQELFNEVVTKVVAQGEPSLSGGPGTFGPCLYRGPRGLKCAAGHAITDAEWAEFGADHNSDGLHTIMGVPGFPPRLWPHINLLGELQRAHDRAGRTDFVASFVEAARDIAERFALTMPVLP